MRENWKEAAFGMFFWVAMILLFVQTIVLPAEKDRLARIYMPVILKSAQGLREGSRVTVLGVDKGTVLHLTYLPVDRIGRIITEEDIGSGRQQGQKVLAILHMNDPVELRPDYRINTRYTTVISDKVVDIYPGNGPVADIMPVSYLSPNEVFYLMKHGRISLAGKTIPEAQNYDDPLTAVADVLAENRIALRHVIRNTREITDKINSGHGTIAALINDDRLMLGLEETLLETDGLVRDGRDLYESLRESRASIDLMEGYLIPVISAAAGAP